MKLESTSPLLLKQADELIKNNHPFLKMDDEVYFLGEYTVGALSEHSKINKLILNYKKPLDRKGQIDWGYKEQAIQQAAELFRNSIFNTIDLSDRALQATLVPIPPSMAKDSSAYDDRNHKMLQFFMAQADIRELISQKETRTSLHASKGLRDPRDLMNNYVLNQGVISPKPKEIWLFDDIIAKGPHFRAICDFLKEKFPGVPIVGFFIARAISKI